MSHTKRTTRKLGAWKYHARSRHWEKNPLPEGKYRYKITTLPIGSTQKSREGRGNVKISTRKVYEAQRAEWYPAVDRAVIEDNTYEGTFSVDASGDSGSGRVRIDFRRRVGPKYRMTMCVEFWRDD